jgi:2-dehydro-3-deoxygalactonokinase
LKLGTILGDWGSSRLRLWRLNDGKLCDRREGPGIVGLPQSPAVVLANLLAPWLEQGDVQQIILCGMVGARGGLNEVGYVDCPATLGNWCSGAAALAFNGIPLRIAAGLASRSEAGVPDVMRGEETQVFGAIALRPELGQGRQRVVLPGTHSKWIDLEDGQITGFRTFLTGELFGLLTRSSLLAAGASEVPGDEAAGFADGIARAQGAAGMLGSLFEARAAQLRDGRSVSWARGYLSGLVIGTEMAEMLAAEPNVGELTIIGDPELTARYGMALDAYGGTVFRSDGDDCVIAGLRLLDADD